MTKRTDHTNATLVDNAELARLEAWAAYYSFIRRIGISGYYTGLRHVAGADCDREIDAAIAAEKEVSKRK